MRDLKVSHEGALIVSARFREVVLASNPVGAVFAPLRTELEDVFVFGSSQELDFDPDRGRVFYGPRCDLCGSPAEVSRILPMYLRQCGHVLSPNAVYCTSVCCGYPRYKSKPVVVGATIRDALVAASLTGCRFDEAYVSC